MTCAKVQGGHPCGYLDGYARRDPALERSGRGLRHYWGQAVYSMRPKTPESVSMQLPSYTADDPDGDRVDRDHIDGWTMRYLRDVGSRTRSDLDSSHAASRSPRWTPPNRLQGGELDVTLVWHSLSGRQDAPALRRKISACSSWSCRRIACAVVTRAGFTHLLGGVRIKW
jgi:hypothetical protein